jgi:prefoldin subunit 5
MEERRNFEESFEVLRSQLELLQSEKLELSQMIRERESTLAPM